MDHGVAFNAWVKVRVTVGSQLETGSVGPRSMRAVVFELNVKSDKISPMTRLLAARPS